MNIIIFILKKISVIFRSLGKKEHKLNNYIKYLTWKKRKDIFLLEYSDKDVNNLLPKKLAICVTFFYNEEKINILRKVCKEFNNLAQNIDVTIITNENDSKKINNLRISLEEILKDFKIHSVQDLQHPKFLPWSHLVVMRQKILDDSFTHFLYLEDDILLTKENIIYWINARNALRPYNLIPSFLRTEINFKDKEVYVVDSTKQNDFKKTPKVFSKNKEIAFVNLLFPHQPIYLYDKELMNEYFNGAPSNPDFAIISARDHYQGIVERLDLMLTHYNVPQGFLHRAVAPVDYKNKIIKDYCLVKHLSNKYANMQSVFSVIKVKDLFTF